jgi:hypothetical protein
LQCPVKRIHQHCRAVIANAPKGGDRAQNLNPYTLTGLACKIPIKVRATNSSSWGIG